MRFTYSQTESLNLSAGKWSEFSCIPFPRTFYELLHRARTHTALEATESLLRACRAVQTREILWPKVLHIRAQNASSTELSTYDDERC